MSDLESDQFSVQMRDTPANSTDISPLLENAQPVFQSTKVGAPPEQPTRSGTKEGLSEISLATVQETVVHNKLSTLNGCYVPCLLNIMGIILFLRLGWAVGEAGVFGVLVIFAVTEVASILTVLSLSAIVSNGAMHGGGCYFMISRTLGPEFGGSIGILFYFAYAVGCTFYVTGFAEELRNTYFPDESAWFIVGISSIVLFLCMIVALMGAAWFTKINVFLFVLQMAAIFLGLFAMFFRTGPVDLKTDDTEFLGFSFENLGRMWSSGYNHDADKCPGSSCTFPIVFAVIMPATTGIMEGANLSGDLKDPGYSIPVGTIAAVGTSIVFYLLLTVGYGGSYSRHTLLNSDTVLQETTWADWVVISGVLISSASSALGALFGGSRILQALARDNVFPGLGVFGQGTTVGDEPTYAVLLTWVITQGCCLIFQGSLDAVANFISALFCLSYASVNLSAFLLEVSGTPNFRPKWKYYTWHTCLVGMFTYFCLMFYLNWIFGIVAVAAEVLIFLFLVYRAPKMLWGEVTQSVIFHQVRKYLLRLDERKMHSKLWRPSVLLLLTDVDHALIDFCNQLKKGGLYIIGNTLVGDFQELAGKSHTIRSQWISWIEEHAYKAFPQVAIGPDLRTCYQNLMLLAGLGAMSPNTVVIPRWHKPSGEEERKPALPRRSSIFKTIDQALMEQIIQGAQVEKVNWVECLQDVLAMRKNIVVTDNFQDFDIQLISSKKLKQIYKRKRRNGNLGSMPHSLDVVIQADDYNWDTDTTGDVGFPMLLLQLAHIVSLNKKWQRIVHMRILLFISDQDEIQVQENLRGFLYLARISIEQIITITAPQEEHVLQVGKEGVVELELCRSYQSYYEQMNQLILKETKYSRFVFMKLPNLPPIDIVSQKEADRLSELYVDSIIDLTAGFPPSALVATGERINAISLDI